MVGVNSIRVRVKVRARFSLEDNEIEKEKK